MDLQAKKPNIISLADAKNVDFLADILNKIKVSGGDASDIILPPAGRGKKISRVCIGLKDVPCEDNLQNTEENKHLFSKNVRSRCKKCQAAYSRAYYHENKKRCVENVRNSTKRSRARQGLIAHGAKVLCDDPS